MEQLYLQMWSLMAWMAATLLGAAALWAGLDWAAACALERAEANAPRPARRSACVQLPSRAVRRAEAPGRWTHRQIKESA